MKTTANTRELGLKNRPRVWDDPAWPAVRNELIRARAAYLAAAIAMEMGPEMDFKRAAYEEALAEARALEDRVDPFAYHRNFKRREEVRWERHIRRHPHLDPRNMYWTEEELAS